MLFHILGCYGTLSVVLPVRILLNSGRQHCPGHLKFHFPENTSLKLKTVYPNQKSFDKFYCKPNFPILLSIEKVTAME
jgi:hypothetical protein